MRDLVTARGQRFGAFQGQGAAAAHNNLAYPFQAIEYMLIIRHAAQRKYTPQVVTGTGQTARTGARRPRVDW